jgi:hypothetical protein
MKLVGGYSRSDERGASPVAKSHGVRERSLQRTGHEPSKLHRLFRRNREVGAFARFARLALMHSTFVFPQLAIIAFNATFAAVI